MKTLYNQLGKDNKAKLNKGLSNYPATLQALKIVLDNLFYPTELKITDASTLHDAIYPNKLFDLNKLYNLFSNE